MYKGVHKTNREDALRAVVETLPELALRLSDYARSCPYFQTRFEDQVTARLETGLLAPEGTAEEPVLAVSKAMFEVFDATAAQNIQKVCTQVPEVTELHQRLEVDMPEAIRLLGRIMRWLNALVLKNRVAECAELKEALDDVVETIDELLNDTKTSLNDIVVYHASRSTLITQLRKQQVLDMYLALILLDVSRITDIREAYMSISDNFLLLCEQLHRKLDILKKGSHEKLTAAIYY